MELTEVLPDEAHAYMQAPANPLSVIAARVSVRIDLTKIRSLDAAKIPKQRQAAGSVTSVAARPSVGYNNERHNLFFPGRGAVGVLGHEAGFDPQKTAFDTIAGASIPEQFQGSFVVFLGRAHPSNANQGFHAVGSVSVSGRQNASLVDHIVPEKSTAFGVKDEEAGRDFLADHPLQARSYNLQNGLKRHVLATADDSSADELGERIKEYGQSRVHFKLNCSSIRISSSSSMSTGQSDLVHGYMRTKTAPCIYLLTAATAKISPTQNLSGVVHDLPMLSGPQNQYLSQIYTSGPENSLSSSINIGTNTLDMTFYNNCLFNNLNKFPDGPSGSDRSNHHQRTLGDESACRGNSGHRGAGGSMICPGDEQRGADGRNGGNSSGDEPSEGGSNNSNWFRNALVFLGLGLGLGFCGILLVKTTSRVPMDTTFKLQVGVKSTTERQFFLKGASKRR